MPIHRELSTPDSPFAHSRLQSRTAAAHYRFGRGLRTLLLGASVLGLLLLPPAAAPVSAEVAGSGPVFTAGWTDDSDQSGEDQTLTPLGLGWHWRWDGPASINESLQSVGLELSWQVEALGAVILGDRETVEASAVPYFRLEPSSAERWIPYLEGGVGLIYSDVRGFDLGSHFLFSDNVGAGITFVDSNEHRWGLGYRLRHISHAGLWADANDGLNTHFLVFSYE